MNLKTVIEFYIANPDFCQGIIVGLLVILVVSIIVFMFVFKSFKRKLEEKQNLFLQTSDALNQEREDAQHQENRLTETCKNLTFEKSKEQGLQTQLNQRINEIKELKKSLKRNKIYLQTTRQTDIYKEVLPLLRAWCELTSANFAHKNLSSVIQKPFDKIFMRRTVKEEQNPSDILNLVGEADQEKKEEPDTNEIVPDSEEKLTFPSFLTELEPAEKD